MSGWSTLIQRYKPENARVCNCGQAYEYQCGIGAIPTQDGSGLEYRSDLWACPDGCSAAQIHAKEHVARCILAEESGDAEAM